MGSSPIMCYSCNKKGHTARNCLAPAPASKNKSNTSDSKPKSESNNNSGVGWSVYNTTDVTEVARESYVLDSGSTLHILKDIRHFVYFRESTGTITGIANTNLNVTGVGTDEFIDPETSFKITLNDVCYVPDAMQNLISIKKASSTGAFTFYSDHAMFTNSADNISRKIATLKVLICMFWIFHLGLQGMKTRLCFSLDHLLEL